MVAVARGASVVVGPGIALLDDHDQHQQGSALATSTDRASTQSPRGASTPYPYYDEVDRLPGIFDNAKVFLVMGTLEQDFTLLRDEDLAFPKPMRSFADRYKSAGFTRPHFNQFLNLSTAQGTSFRTNHPRHSLNLFPTATRRHSRSTARATCGADDQNGTYHDYVLAESHICSTKLLRLEWLETNASSLSAGTRWAIPRSAKRDD